MKKQISATKTRNSNDTGHVRLKRKDLWEGQYWWEGKRKSVYGRSEAECRGKLNGILADIYKGSYINGSAMPFYSYLKWYQKSCTNTRPSTQSNFDIYFDGHIYHSRLGNIALKNLTTEDFNAFFKEKKNSGRLDGKPGGLKPKTLRNIKNALSQALDYAVNIKHYIPYNPLKSYKIAVPKPKIETLCANEFCRLEEAVFKYEDVNALMTLIDLYAGPRIGELCALTWADFGFNKSYFEINNTLERLYKKYADQAPEFRIIELANSQKDAKTALYLGPPKTDESRRKIYTNKVTVLAFEHIEQYQKKQGLYKPDGFVFVQKNGNPFEPRRYQELHRKIMASAEVTYRKFHTMRHTFASRAVELHIDIGTLSEILGHAQKSTTLNMYDHSREELKKQAMQMFNQLGSDTI